QVLKFHMALFGYDYFGSLNVTDGTLEMRDGLTPDCAHTVNHVYVRPKPGSNCSLVEYKPNHPPSHVKHAMVFTIGTPYSIYWDYIVNECPIGFSVDSSQGGFICACSQSVSRENVTCNITSLNITHNGLLWIGIYDTSTLFNANATDPNACIINEDCLLYCSPNPVTFKLNDTDTQCVDNRGQRMCGSCTEGYSLLMGSNKCGQCHNNHVVVVWIVLFAVMGVLLVVLLIALNLTVSVGTLNGLLFYANIVNFILIIVYHLHLQLSHMKCYDALIKKLFKKQDEDDDPLLDVTESYLTVDQQKRKIVPSSTNYVRRESVVDLF
uniref:Uncharacterized protein n=1 Tax=Amphimedon queenslandica TaxID=400682 RepID=A0A1X7VG62_AMPQE